MLSDLAKDLRDTLTDEPQSARELKDKLGLRTGSELRDLVDELRANGYPVCSRTTQGGGYWYGNAADIGRTIADLKSRRRELSDVIAALERGPLYGQMEVSL